MVAPAVVDVQSPWHRVQGIGGQNPRLSPAPSNSENRRYDISRPMADDGSSREAPLLTQHVLDEGERPVTLNKALLAGITTGHLLLRRAAICKHELQKPCRKAPTYLSLSKTQIRQY